MLGNICVKETLCRDAAVIPAAADISTGCYLLLILGYLVSGSLF